MSRTTQKDGVRSTVVSLGESSLLREPIPDKYSSLIDLCIKNAIISVQEQNTYAQTERERRPTRRSAQASPGVAGFRLLSQRSGTAHWLQSKFGDALARYSTEGRSQGIVRTIFPRTTTEAGSAASTALGQL